MNIFNETLFHTLGFVFVKLGYNELRNFKLSFLKTYSLNQLNNYSENEFNSQSN